jgi:hypothetical protein
MSVSFHRNRNWDPEPRLDDLFDDPVLLALMTRDRIDRPALQRVIDGARSRLGRDRTAADFEASLFAECRAA